jgi:hypothetical protein
MSVTCPKCRYVRQPTDTAPDYECPQCGVIYHKFLQAQRAQAGAGRESPAPPPEPAKPAAPDNAAPAPHTPAAQPRTAPLLRGETRPDPEDEDLETFTERLRADSRYPTFRELVKIVFFVWMALAVLMALGGIVSLIQIGGIAGFGALIVSLFFAVLFVVIGRISRELSLMLVDLSDAAVRIASRVRA